MDNPDGFVYDAFISYSRKNSEIADKVERDLQSFPLTRDIRKRLGRRHLNVFRDVNDLTGNRLTPALEQNLVHSRSLVVLCSPAARASTYVGLEINRFAQLRDPDRIVPVLVAGVPNNERDSDPDEWAFPDALADTLGDAPLAPDLRRAWAAKRRKAKLSQGSPWIQLVAGIVGVRPDDLTERIARTERRRLQGLVGGLAVILAVVSSLSSPGLSATTLSSRPSSRPHGNSRPRPRPLHRQTYSRHFCWPTRLIGLVRSLRR